MVLYTNNWRIWLAGLAASLVIFGVVFFTVIQPAQNQANTAFKTGIQQTQQAINQAKTQLSTAGGSTKAVSATVNKQLDKAAQLTQCVSAAGLDAGKVAACQTKFSH